jgi:NADH:ubiquinone oxidoreductase subunit 6 (subunit J)
MQSGILGILYLVGAVLITLVAVIAICRRRLAAQKQSFFLCAIGTTLVANAIFPLSMILAGRIYAEGFRAFSSEAWRGLHSFASSMSNAVIFAVIGTVFCIIPALLVAFYFERRSKK